MSGIIALAIEFGFPLIEGILRKRIGSAGAGLATEVLSQLAEQLGVLPDDLEAAALAEPEMARAAMRAVETELPERITLYAAELEGKLAIFAGEKSEALWIRAWRPLGMYGLGALWFWNVIILHVVNAVYKIALPQMPFSDLLTLSGLYMSLYMGGHTVKAVFDSYAGRGTTQ